MNAASMIESLGGPALGGDCVCPCCGYNTLQIEDSDGRTLWHCAAGCAQEAVTGALKDKGLLGANGANGKAKTPPPWERPIEAEYNYCDRHGNHTFQVVKFSDRLDPRFLQRRQDGKAHRWNLDGITPELYQLPELLKDLAEGAVVCLPEGEKDVDTLRRHGFAATTNAMGAAKWKTRYSETLRGAAVCIIPDNDPAGEHHLQTVGNALQGYARSVRVLHLPDLQPKGDVSDFLTDQDKADQLERLMAEAPDFSPSEAKPGTGSPKADPLSVQSEDAISPAFSEDALALEFTGRHGDDLRFVDPWGRWLNWSGSRWVEDRTLRALDLSRTICRENAATLAEFLKANDKSESPSRKLAGEATVRHVEVLARSDRHHAATVELWDADLEILNMPGGKFHPIQRNHSEVVRKTNDFKYGGRK